RQISTQPLPNEEFNPNGVGTYSVNEDCTGFVDVEFPSLNSNNRFEFHRAFVLSNDGKTVHMLWTEVHFPNIVQSQLPDNQVTCAPATGGCFLAVQLYSDGERY